MNPAYSAVAQGLESLHTADDPPKMDCISLLTSCFSRLWSPMNSSPSPQSTSIAQVFEENAYKLDEYEQDLYGMVSILDPLLGRLMDIKPEVVDVGISLLIAEYAVEKPLRLWIYFSGYKTAFPVLVMPTDLVSTLKEKIKEKMPPGQRHYFERDGAMKLRFHDRDQDLTSSEPVVRYNLKEDDRVQVKIRKICTCNQHEDWI